MLLADSARLLEAGGGERANPRSALRQCGIQFRKQIPSGGIVLEFRFHRSQLGGGQLLTFSVCEQTVEAARDMAQMEGDGCDAGGASVQLTVGQLPAPFLEVFFR